MNNLKDIYNKESCTTKNYVNKLKFLRKLDENMCDSYILRADPPRTRRADQLKFNKGDEKFFHLLQDVSIKSLLVRFYLKTMII